MQQKQPRTTAAICAIGLLVGGTVAPVAYETKPAFSVETKNITVAQMAAADAQRLIVSSNIETTPLDRESYSATTVEEITAKKEAEAAAVREAEEKAAAEKAAANAKNNMKAIPANVPAPIMLGDFAWPVTGYHINSWEENGFRTKSRPSHKGLDMLAPAMTPIYSLHGGKVITSSESSNGWGVVVMVSSVIDGQQIITTYAHMTYGTRAVNVGDEIAAGTLLGKVGMTGTATANHLHLEININGSFIDPRDWLEKNLGPVG